MKAEFELSLNNDGQPCIRFRHFDKDISLEQRTLQLFLEKAKEKGIALKNTSGFLESGTSNSWENYEIYININN